MNENNLCPICGEGHLQPQVGKNPVEYKGQTAELEFHFSLCDACGSEQSNATQLRVNKRAMMAFKKRVDGLLTGAEVRALRERLGLSQAEAARIFGGGPVAFSKYESDDVAQSEAMDKLLRLADELPAAFVLLARRAGFEDKVPGGDWEEAVEWSSEMEPRPGDGRPRLRLVSSSTPMEVDEPPWGNAA